MPPMLMTDCDSSGLSGLLTRILLLDEGKFDNEVVGRGDAPAGRAEVGGPPAVDDVTETVVLAGNTAVENGAGRSCPPPKLYGNKKRKFENVRK
jgi:hypothetical protein